MDPVHALRSEVRHEVEGPLLRFLNRRPVQPLAWLLLAWSLETRGALAQANEAIRTGVRALNIAAAGADKDTSLELESALQYSDNNAITLHTLAILSLQMPLLSLCSTRIA